MCEIININENGNIHYKDKTQTWDYNSTLMYLKSELAQWIKCKD